VGKLKLVYRIQQARDFLAWEEEEEGDGPRTCDECGGDPD